MAPTLNSGNYAKDLSKAPSFDGVSHYKMYDFIVPDDTLIYRIVERQYAANSEYDYVAEVYRLGFHSQESVEEEIERLRDEGESDEEVVRQIIKLGMEDDSQFVLVARFAYDYIEILDPNQQPVSGVQIRGAFVEPQKSGVGLAGQIYRQFVLIHGVLVCDNAQTEYGAALWAGTIRNVVGRVDIYDCYNDTYIQELGENGKGVNGFIPWDLNVVHPHVFQLTRWVQYPFQISRCNHIVLVVSR